MHNLTIGQLHDIIRDTNTAIERMGWISGPDNYRAFMRLCELEGFLRDIIGTSHMGCAADEIILELGDEPGRPDLGE
jgi:hypothetical protein